LSAEQSSHSTSTGWDRFCGKGTRNSILACGRQSRVLVGRRKPNASQMLELVLAIVKMF